MCGILLLCGLFVLLGGCGRVAYQLLSDGGAQRSDGATAVDGGAAGDADVCIPGASGPDADGDGVTDACDRCLGTDDTVDSDGDGTPDGCEQRLLHSWAHAEAGRGDASDTVVLTFAYDDDVRTDCGGRIGNWMPLMDGYSGTQDFDRDNDPEFAAVASCLTDANPGMVLHGLFEYEGVSGGEAGRDDEADLAGEHLALLRRKVDSLHLAPARMGTTWEYSVDLTWEAWGSSGRPRTPVRR